MFQAFFIVYKHTKGRENRMNPANSQFSFSSHQLLPIFFYLSPQSVFVFSWNILKQNQDMPFFPKILHYGFLISKNITYLCINNHYDIYKN